VTLLRSILDPSNAVEEAFTQYTVKLDGGDVLTGLLQSEIPSTINLRTADGTDEIVLRSDVDWMKSSPGSLMPEGLVVGLSSQDLADLISFIRFGLP